MLTLIGQQMFIFGLPAGMLGVLFLQNRKTRPVIDGWGVDLWIFPLLFSVSLIGLNGLPPRSSVGDPSCTGVFGAFDTVPGSPEGPSGEYLVGGLFERRLILRVLSIDG